MSKRTRTRNLGDYTFGTSVTGKPIAVPLSKPRPVMPRVARIIKCGVFDVTVMVAPGQIINEAKFCKKYLKEKRTW